MVIDFNIIEQIIPTDHLCEACINGKQARLPFQKFKNKDYIQHPLFVVHQLIIKIILFYLLTNLHIIV